MVTSRPEERPRAMAAGVAVALDVDTVEAALALVDRIGPAIAWYKVGPVLYIRDGPRLVRELVERGKLVFLDLKWHDIPNTVKGAVEAARDLGVSLATVHISGGERMLEAAVNAAAGAVRLAGVGVLTSMDAREYGVVVSRPVEDAGEEQERLVALGMKAGLDGFVCAATEVGRIRQLTGSRAYIVTPGIRRRGDPADDQRRTATPGDAVRSGADLLVVGRPITGAADPALAVGEMLDEVRTAWRPDGV